MQDKKLHTVASIFDDLKKHYNLKTYRELAAFLDIKEGTLNAWKTRNSIGDIDAILTKCRGLSYDWLTRGEGEMFREVVQGAPKATRDLSLGGAAAGCEKETGLLPFNPDEVVVMQVYVTGGAGAPYEFIPSEPIEEIVIPRSFYKKSIIPVKVRGRSMETTLRDGAVVGVDRADRQVVNGELFAVWLPYQGTVIKRLYLNRKRIQLRSDNEEFRSEDIEVALDEVDDQHFIQGRVKWAIQML